MKRLTFHIVLLHGLVLGIFSTMLPRGAVQSAIAPTTRMDAVAKTVVVPVGENGGNSRKQKGIKKRLKPGQVWVLGKNQQVQPENFAWVVEDIKKASQQPFLQLAKTPDAKKPEDKKPDEKTKPSKPDDLKPFEEVTKDTQRLDGLFTLYRNKEKNKIYLEIKPEQLNKNFLTTATLESGIGEGGIYSGMPLQDFLFYFQRVNNNLQFVVRNVNFRTNEGDPQARSLARSFSDSVLYNIPIKSIHRDRKTLLIDLGDLLLTDLAGLSASLGVTSSRDSSYFGNAKTFPQNIEIESVMNVIGRGGGSGRSKEIGLPNFEVLADNRGFTLRIHYSLSQLADKNYRPRIADERVGYFITAYQDLSSDERRDPFVRYVNRWNLEKQDPNAAISPPKKPIVFWIDNAVPFEYRDAIKEGVLMWNQAFEKAGFKDAIQVQQMPENAAWDPADIRYNTIRWINTVDGFFAMGPSRVNPLTGEILDADILVDASFVRALKNDYRQIVQPNQTQNRTTISALMQNRLLCANGLDAKVLPKDKQQGQNQGGFLGQVSRLAGEYDLCYGMEAANQFAVGKMTMTMLPTVQATSEQIKTYINQYLRLIIAHEVGHTLGLRHNFRGSTMLKPEEMNNTEITRTRGLTTSVMDYIPPNIAPKGTKQGDYFPSMVGQYDDWAIKYGYAPVQVATTSAEKPFLEKIAQESATNPQLSYSTDEDMFDLDPTVNAWDNSGNVLTYSQWQLDNSRQLWDLINKRYPNDDGISGAGEQFGTVLGNYFQNIFFATKYIGGQSFYRVRSSDRNGRLPFEPVAVEKQREALATLQKYVFADDAFNFPPELLNKLAPSRWRHWGSNPQVGRLDYPIHDLVLFIQSSVLVDLLSGDRLSRIKDIELKTQSGKALTIPELFDTLQSGIWTEVIKPKSGDIKISSLRRGIQRRYLDVLTGMVLRKGEDSSGVPEDARTIAWYKLKQLDEKLKSVNSEDEYTKAHILETRDRIDKILDARLQSN
jgi:predicted Zn-dependent protease